MNKYNKTTTNETSPMISVVMVNYNGLNYLKQTVPPLLKLNYTNLEIILIDNGSTDGSKEFIESFKRIRLIVSPVNNKNKACNYAINQSNGDFILLLDNDALLVNSNLLNTLLKRYDSRTGIIGLSFIDKESIKSSSYGGFFCYHYVNMQKEISKEDLRKYDFSQIGFPEGKGFFIKKSIWNDCEGYDEHVVFGCDDTDMGIKTIMKGYYNYLYSETIQVHLGRSERNDSKKYAWKWEHIYYAHFYSILKNYSWYNLITAVPSYLVWGFLKLLYQSLKRKNLSVFFSWFKACYKVVSNIEFILGTRNKVQKERIIKNDSFLTIRPK